MSRLWRTPPRPHSRRPNPMNTTSSRSSLANARSFARCIRPQPWRSDMNRAAPEPQANMGQPEPRVEARLKVTGEARYASDFQVSNPAFAFLVTSPIAKGSIQSIKAGEARAVRGVLDIFTHENTGELKPVKFGGGGGGASTSIQDLGPKIQHDGQIVAMVVADTFEAAREAAYRLRISYQPETPSATFKSPGTTEEDASKATERAKDLPQAGDAET